MQGLPVPPFTLKKCYRDIITGVIKEGHKRWTHRNTQLSESGDLTPRPWSPKARTLTTAPSSQKRKRDVAWSSQRITETNMQKILHKFTHTSTKDTKTPSGQVDKTGGESSEGECVGGGMGSWDGDRGPREIQEPAEDQPHIEIGTGTGGNRWL